MGARARVPSSLPINIHDVQPITVAIFSQLRQFGSNIELIARASFVSLAIPLCVFFAFQRYFVQGLLAGSVK
jgi:alpha-glucoside transport system permease protein